MFLASVDLMVTASLDDLRRMWPVGDGTGAMAGTDLPGLLADLVGAGGKRIRPRMVHLGHCAAGGPVGAVGSAPDDTIVRLGTALEMLHVFALVHDDVMDESSRRRGRPTAHEVATSGHVRAGARGDARRFGESIAILLGDLAHAEADRLVAGLPAEVRSLWRELTVELVAGQELDLIGSATATHDLRQARQVARMKSGAYTIQRPLQLGAVATGADAATQEALLEYGRALGEAFALRDDILGAVGDPALTGKPAGDDLVSGKPTVLLALARQRFSGEGRARLDRVGTPGIDAADIAALQRDLHECGVVDEVEAMITARVDDAVRALAHPGLAPDGVAGLTAAAATIAWRDR